jgi:outer membrane lipoprotein-sorting protein
VKRRALLLVLVVFGSGCAAGRVAMPGGRPVPEGVRAAVLASLRERNETLSSIKGFATVRYGSALFGARGETAFAVQGPDRFRVDGLADFGLYQSQMASDGRTLRIVWPLDGLYFEGEAAPESFGRYLRVGLPPETIAGILLGRVPLDGGEDFDVRAGRGGRYVVRGGRLAAVVERRDGENCLPVEYTVTDGEGRPVYRVAFSDYVREGRALWFADRMTARFWGTEDVPARSRIEVAFKEIEINPKIDAKLFLLKIPPDAKPVSD